MVEQEQMNAFETIRAEMNDANKARLDEAMQNLSKEVQRRATLMVRAGVTDQDEIDSEASKIFESLMENASFDDFREEPERFIDTIEQATTELRQRPEPEAKGS